MEITEALMKHILSKTTNHREVTEHINKYVEISKSIKYFESEALLAEKVYREKLEDLRKSKRETQKQCDHPVFGFSSDPSGGNDSSHDCDICKWEW